MLYHIRHARHHTPVAYVGFDHLNGQEDELLVGGEKRDVTGARDQS